MKKYDASKVILKIDGQEIVFMNGFYQHYENSESLSICTGEGNKVLSVENISKDEEVRIVNKEEVVATLAPGQKFVFETVLFTREELNFTLKKKIKTHLGDLEEEDLDDDTYGNLGDCND